MKTRMSATEEELINKARLIQNIHYQYLGGFSYDLLQRCDFRLFGEILAHYLPQTEARKLADTIIQNQSNTLEYRILIVNFIYDSKLYFIPVIRVLEDSKVVFYDPVCHKYSHWDDFKFNNQLPKCLMIFPTNGAYTERNGNLELGTEKSPAENLLSQIDKYLYVAAESVSIATLVLPMFSFSKPYSTEINVASALSGGYKIGHHSYQLYDRYTHGQPIDISDETACMHWSHIGNSLLCFGFTVMKNKYGNPSSGECDIRNLIVLKNSLFKLCTNKDKYKSYSVIKGEILSGYMMDFPRCLMEIFDFNLDMNKVLTTLRSFIDGKDDTVFRKMIYVDGQELKKVVNDIRNSCVIQNIPICWNSLVEEMQNTVVSKLEEEVNSWKYQHISNNQLKFRTNGICQNGCRTYETITELCQLYQVDSLENIVINNKSIFQNVGGKKFELENLIQDASKKFPQLLSYAVEYASENDCIDWDRFRPHFTSKLSEESMNLAITCSASNISWFDALNFQHVNFSYETSANRIIFVKPRNESNGVSSQDLINLGKKLLGIVSISYVDFLVTNPSTKWTVMISKAKKRVIIIGPVIETEITGISGSYPVFIKIF